MCDKNIKRLKYKLQNAVLLPVQHFLHVFDHNWTCQSKSPVKPVKYSTIVTPMNHE